MEFKVWHLWRILLVTVYFPASLLLGQSIWPADLSNTSVLGIGWLNFRIREAIKQYRQGILELVGSAPDSVELLASTLLESPPPGLLFIEIPGSANTFFFSLKLQQGHNTSCWSYLIRKQNTRKRIYLWSICLLQHRSFAFLECFTMKQKLWVFSKSQEMFQVSSGAIPRRVICGKPDKWKASHSFSRTVWC